MRKSIKTAIGIGATLLVMNICLMDPRLGTKVALTLPIIAIGGCWGIAGINWMFLSHNSTMLMVWAAVTAFLVALMLIRSVRGFWGSRLFLGSIATLFVWGEGEIYWVRHIGGALE